MYSCRAFRSAENSDCTLLMNIFFFAIYATSTCSVQMSYKIFNASKYEMKVVIKSKQVHGRTMYQEYQ